MTEAKNVTAITRAQPQAAQPFEFTAEQRKMIRDSFLSGANDSEAAVLMELARLRRLNPITRQIHFVKRDGVWTSQVGIDGFRAIAERTGLYDGQDEAEFEYDSKGSVKSCRIKVYRKDWSRPAVGVAHFTEYAQSKREGGYTHMWATKPHIMLAKCAEALAFRKAFPEDTSGLYAPEELPDEREVNAAPASAAQSTPQPKRTSVSALKESVKARAAQQQALPVDAEVVEEPAPPTDPMSDFSPEEEQAVRDDESVVFPFGSDKGKPLADVNERSLNFAVEALTKSIGDSTKQRYRADNERVLAAVKRELQRRG